MVEKKLYGFEKKLIESALYIIETKATVLDMKEKSDLLEAGGSLDSGHPVSPLADEFNDAVSCLQQRSDLWQRRLKDAQVITRNDCDIWTPMTKVQEGAYVVIQQNGDFDYEPEKYLICHISFPELGLVNMDTPLAKELLGKQTGDTVTTNIRDSDIHTTVLEVSCGYPVMGLRYDLLNGEADPKFEKAKLVEQFEQIQSEYVGSPSLEDYVAANSQQRINIREEPTLPNQMIPLYRRAALLAEHLNQ
ncbi:MAG: hypothetical protein MAG795_00224 [Candidatus Woesearchaeota archaeon]|nr:hypothetical protein [Candidatus Woesearchaeota archaeon]